MKGGDFRLGRSVEAKAFHVKFDKAAAKKIIWQVTPPSRGKSWISALREDGQSRQEVAEKPSGPC